MQAGLGRKVRKTKANWIKLLQAVHREDFNTELRPALNTSSGEMYVDWVSKDRFLIQAA